MEELTEILEDYEIPSDDPYDFPPPPVKKAQSFSLERNKERARRYSSIRRSLIRQIVMITNLV